MEMSHRLLGQTRQTVAITPRVIQSIKLLKFGHDELCAYLKEQEERNPLIDVIMPEPKSVPAQTFENRTTDLANPISGKREQAASGISRVGSTAGGTRASGDSLPGIEETFAATMTLREVLLQQVEVSIRNEMSKLIAREIVESLEPDGYLRRDIDEIAECLGVSCERVESVLGRVQRFEPSGVGARSLSECLRLQLDEAGDLTAAMRVLLDNLEILAEFDLGAMARLCKVDRQEVAEMVCAIRKLDPRPGKRYDAEAVMPAMPDVNVELRRDGSTHVELNTALLPRVLINREYYSEMTAVATGKEDTRFVSDCMKDANWLTRNLDQRANTLLKVATEIVKRQKDFLLHGVEHIKPLCQGDVAEVLGMHRSTVCRAISGKYMMTNRGLFELKYFFSNAIHSSAGQDDFSAESIRARIRSLIEAEPGAKVLSDDAITAALRAEGIDVARRTVAKYREMMNIPSSSVRRRLRRAAMIEAEACIA